MTNGSELVIVGAGITPKVVINMAENKNRRILCADPDVNSIMEDIKNLSGYSDNFIHEKMLIIIDTYVHKKIEVKPRGTNLTPKRNKRKK